MEEQNQNQGNTDIFSSSKHCVLTHTISSFSLSDFPHIVSTLLTIKKSAAHANYDCGSLSNEKYLRIAHACDALQMHHDDKSIFMVDVLQGGGGFAINSNINEAIIAKDSLKISKPLMYSDINKSQSSQDVCATALRLCLYTLGKKIENSLKTLTKSLNDFITNYGRTPTLARTCWQDALPITIADRFSGITEGFCIVIDDLRRSLENLSCIPMGTTVLGLHHGSSLQFQDRVLIHLSNNFDRLLRRQNNSASYAQNFPDIALVANSIKLICETIVRFGLDLRLQNSGPRGGLGEISLPNIMPSSSFFKDKFNPTIVETAIQGAIFADTMASSISIYRRFSEIDLNVFEWASGIKLLMGMQVLFSSIVRLNDHAIVGMSVNESNCRRLATYFHRSSKNE